MSLPPKLPRALSRCSQSERQRIIDAVNALTDYLTPVTVPVFPAFVTGPLRLTMATSGTITYTGPSDAVAGDVVSVASSDPSRVTVSAASGALNAAKQLSVSATAAAATVNPVAVTFTRNGVSTSCAVTVLAAVSGGTLGLANVAAAPAGMTRNADGTWGGSPWDTSYAAPPTAATVSTLSALQSAVNAAVAGTGPRRIVVALGNYDGTLTLPAGAAADVYIESADLASLPAPSDGTAPCGTRAANRVGPAHAASMPKLRATVQGGGRASACIEAAAGAGRFRFVGLEITLAPGVTTAYGLVGFSSEPSSAALYPHHIVFDRCYIHGTSTATVRQGVYMNGAYLALVDSYVDEIHESGADAQGWLTTAGPGPFKLANNFLSGAGECWMFGGGSENVAGEAPSDVLVAGNHCFHRPEWGTATWTRKNLGEIKLARRVLIYRNVFENEIAAGQNFALPIKTVLQYPGASARQVATQDVTVALNDFRNISGGISVANDPEGTSDLDTARVHLYGNRVTATWNSSGAPGRAFQPDSNVADLVAERNVFDGDSNAIGYSNPTLKLVRHVLKNNLVVGGDDERGYYLNSALSSLDGQGVGTDALTAHCAAGWVAAGNCFVSASSGTYPAGNRYVARLSGAGVTDRSTGNYRLLAGSAGKGGATDGTDPGSPLDTLEALAAAAV